MHNIKTACLLLMALFLRAEEAISNIRTVKSFSAEYKESERYAERVDIAYRLARKLGRVFTSYSFCHNSILTLSFIISFQVCLMECLLEVWDYSEMEQSFLSCGKVVERS